MKKQLLTVIFTFVFAVLTAIFGSITVRAAADGPNPFGFYNELVWTYDSTDHSLTIGLNEAVPDSDGTMPDNWNKQVPRPLWDFYKDSIESVTILPGVKDIGNYAFYGYENLKSAEIAGSVTDIGECAFFGCTALETVTFCEGLKSINTQAFSNCESLVSVTFPKTFETILPNAFAECKNLKEAVFKGNTPNFGDFYDWEMFIFENAAPSFTVYYFEENSSNWLANIDTKTQLWEGYPTKMIPNPHSSPIDLSKTAVIYDDNTLTFTYTGLPIEPKISVKFGSYTIPESAYTVSYDNNTDAGEANITITAKDSAICFGSTSAGFTISKASPLNIGFPTGASELTYGQKLEDSILAGGSPEYGVFKWTTPDTTPAVVNNGYSVTFVPNDLNNYDWSGVTLTCIVPVTIIPAGYEYTVDSAQALEAGSGLSAITAPAGGTGVNGEFVSGTLTWYTDILTGTKATDADINNPAVKTITLYWSFMSSNPNYTSQAKIGTTIFTIINNTTEPPTEPPAPPTSQPVTEEPNIEPTIDTTEEVSTEPTIEPADETEPSTEPTTETTTEKETVIETTTEPTTEEPTTEITTEKQTEPPTEETANEIPVATPTDLNSNKPTATPIPEEPAPKETESVTEKPAVVYYPTYVVNTNTVAEEPPAEPVITPEKVYGNTENNEIQEKTEEITESEIPLSNDNIYINPYIDVKDDDWFASSVQTVTRLGLMESFGSENTFSPDEPITGNMVADILNRLSDKSENEVMKDFEDNILLGNEPLTREQVVAVLYSYAEKSGIDVSARADLSKFGDADKISDWAVDKMQWAVAAGLIIGRSDTELAPGDYATRAELATLITRFLSIIGVDYDTGGD